MYKYQNAASETGRQNITFEIISSIVFIIVNTVLSIFFAIYLSNIIINTAVLTTLYVISALIIKRKRDISFSNILLIQSGINWFTLPGLLLLGALLVILTEDGEIDFVLCISSYLIAVIPAIAVSCLIYKAITRARENRSSSEEKTTGMKKKASGLIIGLSAAFFALNIIFLIIYSLSSDSNGPDNVNAVIISALLAVIYIASALKIKTKTELPFYKIIFVQLGGYFSFGCFTFSLLFLFLLQILSYAVNEVDILFNLFFDFYFHVGMEIENLLEPILEIILYKAFDFFMLTAPALAVSGIITLLMPVISRRKE